MRPNVATIRHSFPPHLGANYGALLTSAPGIAASAGTPAAVAAAGGVATAGGLALSVAIPVAGVVIGAIIGGLFAAHAKRVAGAKQENQVLNSLIPTVMQAIDTVFQAANSGSDSVADCSAGLDQIQQSYWQAVQQVEGGPGQAGGPNKCTTSGSGNGTYTTTCDKSCTAACCVGCIWVENWVDQGKKFLAAGHGSRTFDPIPGNKYGLQTFPGFSINYTAPPPSVASSIPGVSTITSDLSQLPGGSLLSASVFGIPLWMILGGFFAWKAVRA